MPLLSLDKYSIGVGDRFAQQAESQLRACLLAQQDGVTVIPVWNKSHREHSIIGSQPASTRAAADAAVRALGWKASYHVDADHVRLNNVEGFLSTSDYFTLDVGDALDRPVLEEVVEGFISRHPEFLRPISVTGIAAPLQYEQSDLRQTLRRYLPAVAEAGALYRRIAEAKGVGAFITEMSIDETELEQPPPGIARNPSCPG